MSLLLKADQREVIQRSSWMMKESTISLVAVKWASVTEPIDALKQVREK